MSSPEVERFEMTDNDYSQMFDPTSRGRRQTKNQATYGVWADSDGSDEERAGFGRPRQKKGQGASANLSSGISFISGGLKEEASLEKGLKREKEDDSFLESNKKRSGRESAPVPRYVKGHSKDMDKEFGGWERYTKGIGQKLLAKMGHKPGEGLGKKGQGITTPVEAVVRKGRGAVGSQGTERSQRSLRDFPVKDEEAEEEKEFQKQLSQWKKQPEKKQKPKYVYKTAQEVLETGGKRRSRPVDTGPKVKVIDMTGKEQRILAGYHAIGKSHDKPDAEEDLVQETVADKSSKAEAAFTMPELMHNLNLLVDMAEEDIVHNDRRLRHDRDRVVNLKYESERLGDVLQQEERQLERLRSVVEIIISCEERLKPESREPLTLDASAEIFKMLQTDYYEEYKMYDLPALGMAIIFPLMRTFFTGWLPLKDPKFGFLTMLEWKEILGGDEGSLASTTMSSSSGANRSGMDVYQKLIWDVWLPPVRATVLKWNVRDTDSMTALLETWQPALPPWVLGNILDQLVLPRLLQEVEEWNPLTDTTPIHCWLHPWLPLMGDKLEPLYAPIRHKIANALTNWHPSDGSAKIILEPWHGVFKPGHMSAFLVKNIMPKLELEIRGLAINPHQQYLDPWRWVMTWKDMMPIQAMVNMLESAFFPRWHQVLLAWLGNIPNYQDITKWYLGWKAQVPEIFLSHPSVKEEFNKALETMNRAVSGALVPGIKENIAYFTHAERRIMDTKAPPPTGPKDSKEFSSSTSGPVRSGMSVPTTFKDLVERRAEQEDLLYIPISGKTQEGKQVYRFGKASIYYDINVVFMQDSVSGRWLPTSLNTLVDAAR